MTTGREERERRRRRTVCVGVLVGKEGVCQKSLPLTEGMIHSRERQHKGRIERKQQREREREGHRKGGRDAGKKKQTKDADLGVTRHQEDGQSATDWIK